MTAKQLLVLLSQLFELMPCGIIIGMETFDSLKHVPAVLSMLLVLVVQLLVFLDRNGERRSLFKCILH